EGDIEYGEYLSSECTTCHQASGGDDAEGFKYSLALQNASADGLHWTAEQLDLFLADPKGTIPKTKMSFRGLRSPEDRADLIAFLASLTRETTLPNTTFSVSEEILSIEGDIEYGEYLSSECTTCHQASGGDDGIPSIVGWQIEDFVTAMHAYRTKNRENPVMQMVTGRLADEEIAALAVFFQSLGQ
ncbi:MAG: c-type cytochrome, partial [Pseudomonadota bacterium]